MVPKTSISVREMRDILGLSKTESYWLIHKDLFEVRIVAGKMRVMVESFENWYAQQFHYKKVTGEPAGQKWASVTMSVMDMAKLLNISSASAYELLKRKHFQPVKTVVVDNHIRIYIDSFQEWLSAQSHYRIVEKEDGDV